jgi:hypothetical protein
MPSLFRSLLRLYPSAYRKQFGEEMLGVLLEVKTEKQKKGRLSLFVAYLNESGGLVRGALMEQARGMFGLSNISPRRSTMRSEFRFPKATVPLMIIVLLVLAVAIDKARSIEAAVSPASTPLGPIPVQQFTIVGTFSLVFALACICGAVAWGILYAMKRSGSQRLTEIKPSNGAQ